MSTILEENEAPHFCSLWTGILKGVYVYRSAKGNYPSCTLTSEIVACKAAYLPGLRLCTVQEPEYGILHETWVAVYARECSWCSKYSWRIASSRRISKIVLLCVPPQCITAEMGCHSKQMYITDLSLHCFRENMTNRKSIPLWCKIESRFYIRLNLHETPLKGLIHYTQF